MWHGIHGGRHGRDFGPRGCGPRGGGRGRDRWEQFAADFASRWDEAQRGRGGRGGRGRVFDGGELRLVLLKLIADEPRHGYDLIRTIEELTGGSYAPSPGVIYPTLTLLDEQGLIEEQHSVGAKKRFAATAEGQAQLEEKKEEVAALFARLAQVGGSARRAEQAPIRRAMGNLGFALRERLMRGELSDDTLHDVAAMIDELAQKIERLR